MCLCVCARVIQASARYSGAGPNCARQYYYLHFTAREYAGVLKSVLVSGHIHTLNCILECMYVCIHKHKQTNNVRSVCVYVCIACIYVCFWHVCLYVCTCTYRHICERALAHTYKRTHIPHKHRQTLALSFSFLSLSRSLSVPPSPAHVLSLSLSSPQAQVMAVSDVTDITETPNLVGQCTKGELGTCSCAVVKSCTVCACLSIYTHTICIYIQTMYQRRARLRAFVP